MIVRGIGSVSSKSEKFMPFDSTGSRLLAEEGVADPLSVQHASYTARS